MTLFEYTLCALYPVAADAGLPPVAAATVALVGTLQPKCASCLPHLARSDFANGFLFAEIVMRYFPGELQMHSFENASSTAEKQRNWAMLTKFFKVSALEQS